MQSIMQNNTAVFRTQETLEEEKRRLEMDEAHVGNHILMRCEQRIWFSSFHFLQGSLPAVMCAMLRGMKMMAVLGCPGMYMGTTLGLGSTVGLHGETMHMPMVHFKKAVVFSKLRKTGGRKTGRDGDVGKSSKRTGGRKTSSDADAGKSSKRTGGKPPIWRRGGAGKDASEKEFGGNNVATYDYDYHCIEAPYGFSVPGLEVALIAKDVVTASNEARSIYYNGGLHKIVHLHMPLTGVWCITVEDLVSGDVAKLNLKDRSPKWKNRLVLVAVDEADVMAFVELMKSG